MQQIRFGQAQNGCVQALHGVLVVCNIEGRIRVFNNESEQGSRGPKLIEIHEEEEDEDDGLEQEIQESIRSEMSGRY